MTLAISEYYHGDANISKQLLQEAIAKGDADAREEYDNLFNNNP